MLVESIRLYSDSHVSLIHCPIATGRASRWNAAPLTYEQPLGRKIRITGQINAELSQTGLITRRGHVGHVNLAPTE